jgi:hypothetical protein
MILCKRCLGTPVVKQITSTTMGEVSTVGIAVAGLGTKGVRVANLPPEVPDTALTTSLAPFGKVLTIRQEMWTKMYR